MWDILFVRWNKQYNAPWIKISFVTVQQQYTNAYLEKCHGRFVLRLNILHLYFIERILHSLQQDSVPQGCSHQREGICTLPWLFRMKIGLLYLDMSKNVQKPGQLAVGPKDGLHPYRDQCSYLRIYDMHIVQKL